MNKVRFFSLFLALLLCLSAVSCANGENTTQTVPESAPETVSYPTDPLPEGELLSLTENWTSRGEEGVLDEAASCHVITVTEKADLDPYRSFLKEFSAEDEARILADKKGKLMLLEITSSRDTAFYSINSIFRGAGVIEIQVTEEDGQSTEPFHTFFLIYFPSEIYRGESVQAVFLG